MTQHLDEMELLTRMGADVEPDPAALLRARRRLLRHAVAPRVRRRRRALLAAGGVAAAAVVAVGALLVAPGPQGAQPAAAAVLQRAAAVADEQPMPRPGEYLHVRKVQTEVFDGRRQRSIQEFWVPGDLRGDEVFLDSDGTRYADPVDAPAIWTDPSVDVDGLVAWLERPNGDLRGDGAAWERAGETLSDAAPPSAFKALLFDAIVRIGGVRVVDESLCFHGRDAVVLGRAADGPGTEFVFDRDTGAYLGMRASGDGSPGPWRSTVTTSRVVGSLPARARG